MSQGSKEADFSIYTGLNSSQAHCVKAKTQPIEIPALPPQHQMATQKQVFRTLKAVKSSRSAVIKSERDQSSSHKDECQTDFFVWGVDKHGQLGQNIQKK